MNKAEAAIMGKISLLYADSEEGGDRFLAFHPLAIPMTEPDFAFHETSEESALSPQEKLRAAADFATRVNLIPPVSSVWSHDGALLWNVVETVLSQAEVAADRLRPEEEAELAAARALLYEDREVMDSITGEKRDEIVPTPTLEAYRRFEQAYFEVREQWVAAKVTAEHAEDPAVREEWRIKSEQMERAVEQARRDWVVQGHMHTVEDAFADIDRLTGRGPQLVWDDWKENMRRSQRTDVVIDRTFYETSFMPADFYQTESEGAWTQITLDKSEIESLAAEALQDMPDLFTDDGLDDALQADLEIEELSVDLARVEIIRPWFDPALLRSRAWRWSHDAPPLSDGGEPPTGILVAYPTALIFARNLQIELKQGSERNAQAVAELQTGNRFSFGPLILEQVASIAEANTVTTLKDARFDPQETRQVRTALTHMQPHLSFATTLEAEPARAPVADRVLSSIISRTSSRSAQIIRDHRGSGRPLVRDHRRGGRPEIRRPSVGVRHGQVLEKGSDQPIAQVHITFEKEDGSLTRTVRTGEDGRYRIELPAGRYTAMAHRSGYAPFTTHPGFVVFRADQTGVFNVTMEKNLGEETDVDKWASVQLLAFVCSVVSKSPDPDPGLTWA